MSIEVITILLTVLFGIPSYLALRKEKTTRLVFVEEDKIDLYSKLSTSFNELEVKYQGKKIEDRMFLLRGYLICLGKNDIIKEHYYKPISFDINESGTWHEARVISTNDSVNISLNLEKSSVSMNPTLLKDSDVIYLEFLGEAEKNEYKINHRIAQVSKAKITNFNSLKSIRSGLLVIFGLLIFGSFILINEKPYKINDTIDFDINIEKNDSLNTTKFATITTEGSKTLQTADTLINNYEDSLSFKTTYFHFLINNNYKIETPNGNKIVYKYRATTHLRLVFVAVLGFASILIFAFFVLIRSFFRTRKIVKLINNSAGVKKISTAEILKNI